MVRRVLGMGYGAGRKLVVAGVGALVVLAGVALVPLPGPGLLVIPLGLGILAAEFAWAARWLERLRATARHALASLGRRLA